MSRILLVGKGGREHALAWRLSQSPPAEHIYGVPGNGGTARSSTKISNVEDVKADDYPTLMLRAKHLKITLVVAGSDQAVVDGIEGFCTEAGLSCFAPTKAAAIIEGSKSWAKGFMRRQGIPTAAYGSFDDYEHAKAYLAELKYPTVIKVSGLAAGKGVVIAQNMSDADEALQDFMIRGKFGSAGATVVIEEFLSGDEISVLTFSDGDATRTLPSGQDHKRIFEGDCGPNTGDMGVISPTPSATPEVMQRIEEEVLRPTFEGLRSEGLEFTGLLFTGLMLTASGPKVLEHNARFGDPEAQSVLLLIDESTDLAEILEACTQKRLHEISIRTITGFACNVVVVVAAAGYPESYSQGDIIEIGALPAGVMLFHAGTRLVHEELVTAGGRVLSVAATGPTLEAAVAMAYKGVASIQFANMFYRKDIGRSYIKQRESPIRVASNEPGLKRTGS
ncbi:MAG: hypothetical protein Q9213_007491 [Squamulea squamosa]